MSSWDRDKEQGLELVRPALDAIILHDIQSREVPKALDARPTLYTVRATGCIGC